MNPFDNINVDPTSKGFVDILKFLVLVLFTMLVIALYYLNPPGENTQDDIQIPADLVVKMTWEKENPVDFDLWMKDPLGEVVGHSNRSGSSVKYYKDERGDHTYAEFFQEIQAVEKLFDGWYTINVHMFDAGTGSAPAETTVEIAIRRNDALTTIHEATIRVEDIREEVNVIRLRIKDEQVVEQRRQRGISIIPPMELTE